MSLPLYPLINGKRFDFSSIIGKIFGKQYLGIKEISYDLEMAPGEVYGTSAQKIGRTRGQAKPSGSISVYREEFADLVGLLGGTGFMEVSFPILVTFQEGAIVQSDTLIGARIKKVSNSFSSSADALMAKCDLDLMDIRYVALAGAVAAQAFNGLK